MFDTRFQRCNSRDNLRKYSLLNAEIAEFIRTLSKWEKSGKFYLFDPIDVRIYLISPTPASSHLSAQNLQRRTKDSALPEYQKSINTPLSLFWPHFLKLSYLCAFFCDLTTNKIERDLFNLKITLNYTLSLERPKTWCMSPRFHFPHE